jgi:hypothetical protein
MHDLLEALAVNRGANVSPGRQILDESRTDIRVFEIAGKEIRLAATFVCEQVTQQDRQKKVPHDRIARRHGGSARTPGGEIHETPDAPMLHRRDQMAHEDLLHVGLPERTRPGVGSFAKAAAGVRHTLFFRFALMVIRTETETGPRRASTTWSALKGESLILPSLESVRSIIEQHLVEAGVSSPPTMVLNRLDTIVGMVEAGQGTAIVPSYALPACQRRRVVMSRLTNPTVPIDFYQIRNRGRKLSAAAEEFATFLQGYIARWAGRAGLP